MENILGFSGQDLAVCVIDDIIGLSKGQMITSKDNGRSWANWGIQKDALDQDLDLL